MSARALRLALGALLALELLASGARADPTAPAQPDIEQIEREHAARIALYPVRRRVSRYLEAAGKSVDSGKPDEGRALLAGLDPKRLNPHERALVFRLDAHLAYFAADYAGAREAFEKALAEEVLPLRDENRMRFNIAQLYAASRQWRETVAALERWSRLVREPDSLAHYLWGVAYFQLDEPDAALVHAKLAVELSSEPLESWLQLLASLYTARGDYASAAPVIEQLVTRFPAKRQYWVQLAMIYAARQQYDESLAVQQIAYRQGLLDGDKDLLRVARSALHRELPYEAAQILEKAMAQEQIARDAASLELLANSWIAAREYEQSIPVLAEAARLASDGNRYVRLAQVQMQREEWPEALASIREGIDKGGLADPGKAELLLGICYYHAGRVDEARSAFARAQREDSSREAAALWMSHIERDRPEG